jgi:regulator of protease activity HflC (stomatin/prohibitin superfamily)
VSDRLSSGRQPCRPASTRVRSRCWGAIIGAVVAVALLLGVLFLSLRVAREYERIVVFRLGRVLGAKGPGLIFLIPVIDRPVMVDLREQYLEIPSQTGITRDNASISIDFIVFHRVLDPVDSVVKVQDFAGAAENIAATTLRSVVGDMSLDDVLSKREQMNAVLQSRLDAVTERWGVKVTNVEVREITPPPGVQEAMTRQMSAERTRRAVVTRGRGDEIGGRDRRGRRQAGQDPLRRGRPPGRDPARRGLRTRALEDLRGRAHRRREHDAAAIPRRAQAGRNLGRDQDRPANGTRRHARPRKELASSVRHRGEQLEQLPLGAESRVLTWRPEELHLVRAGLDAVTGGAGLRVAGADTAELR